ncbi:MAG TPA: cell division protein FtsQ/DivIB [Burkholderiales bacterium]|nr:cell division protein FtsQ/DivIB [Burkholderiales bacterium]
MWNKPYMMLWTANLLYALAGVLALFAAFSVAIRLPWFELREVVVSGELDHVTRGQLQQAARQLRGNFFTLDLNQAMSSFEKLPWVRSVSLRRHWPDSLEVVLQEQVPLARWDGGGLVNTYGEVFTGESGRSLPLFSGPEGSAPDITRQYLLFSHVLAPLKLQPVEVQLSQRGAWQILLDNGLLLVLGRERTEARLERFIAVYHDTIGKLPWQPSYVDLRYDNGFALREPQAVRQQNEPVKQDKSGPERDKS